MKVLVVGLGSIANKHVSVLKFIAPNVKIYALRSQKSLNNVEGVSNIYSWEETPKEMDFIIISNPTSEHYATIKKAVSFKVPLFIEKPPLARLTDSSELLEIIKKNLIKTYVAFNLRFHPVIEWLKNNLILSNLREVQVYSGSYLPDWRPNVDYRECYSAKKELGGGVHLDLIHELDYMRWLLGDPIKIRSERSKKSNLEITSFDFANYLLEYPNFFANIILNYYRRDAKRTIEIILDNETWFVDLINCEVKSSSGNILYSFNSYKILYTYQRQMNYFLNSVLLKNNYMNNFEESLRTLALCLG